MASQGFQDLGMAIVGSDIDRQGSFLEGLDTGTRINARRASTQNALAQARLRVDEAEARESLATELEVGGARAAAATIRAGGNPSQVASFNLGEQELGFREGIADLAVPFEQRQANAQAVSGKPIDPFQFGPGGELFTDVFDPNLQVSPTGTAQIAVDESRVRSNDALAALRDEKREHPDRFKSSTTVNVGTGPLSEQILPGGQGETVVPPGINFEEAFGAEAFFKGGLNAVTDFVGAGVFFDDEAQANEVLGNLKVRTQTAMQARVPGRPSQFLLELLGTYAESPRELFRGDEKARVRLRNTLATLERDLKRTSQMIDAPFKKTPTVMGELVDAQLALADLVADYSTILKQLDASAVGDINSIPAPTVTAPGVTQTQNGGSFVVNP